MRAIATGNFKAASESLPSRIEKTFEMPKIWEIKMATSEDNVCAMVGFELIKLAESINVSGNLTEGQIYDIARTLVGEYPNETIADFKICFQRATLGNYGKVWKLDGTEVGQWMKKYLDEKYIVLEDSLNKEKDHYKNEYVKSKVDVLQLWKEAMEQADLEAEKEGTVKRESIHVSMLRNRLGGLTEGEIKQEGKEKPQKIVYPKSSDHEVVRHELHLQYIRLHYDPRTGEKLSNWISESDWLKSLEE